MKKGFTLAELICVIIIMGILIILAIPSINNIINNEKDNISDSMKSIIIQASELYVQNNNEIYSKTDGNTYCIKLQELIDNEYLSRPLKDPVTNDEINENKYVKVLVENEKYNYEIVDICASIEN